MATKTKRRVPYIPSEDRYGQMKEMHCADPKCDKFLGYESLQVGSIQIKCHRTKCKKLTLVTTLPEEIKQPEITGEARCGLCGRLLYREAIVLGIVKVKCRNCGRWNTLDIYPRDGVIIEPNKVEKPNRSSSDVRKGE